jgi:fructose 1,6-bisphosphatase
MKITLSVIKADIGGYVGHSSSHPDILAEAQIGGKLVGPRDMFDGLSFDEARRKANIAGEYMRRHGPFEPHRLPLDEMEYTTMPHVMKKIKGRFTKID